MFDFTNTTGFFCMIISIDHYSNVFIYIYVFLNTIEVLLHQRVDFFFCITKLMDTEKHDLSNCISYAVTDTMLIGLLMGEPIGGAC